MDRVCQHLSSDSDDFEGFLNKIRTPKSTSKFRLSNNSLSDFLTDNSLRDSDDKYASISFLPDKGKEKNDVAEAKMHKVRQSAIENDVDTMNKKSFASSTSKHLPHIERLVLKSIENSSIKKPLKIRSVTTPIKKVYFSSDSDDEVFSKSGSGLKPKTGLAKTPLKAAVFSGSSEPEENNFATHRKVPVVVLSSDSESDDNDVIPSLADRIRSRSPFKVKSPLGKKEISKKNVISISDTSESDDNGFPFNQARLLKNQVPKESPRSAKPRGPSVGSFSTPKLKPIPKQHFQTEKPVRTTKLTCSVKGCFLSSMDLVIPKNSGKNFRRDRLNLTSRLFILFNESVFKNQLPETMEVTWAKRLTKTAGITKCRRITMTQRDDSGNVIASKKYEAAISLSEKVIDSANRLRDTLIHEMCHAAVWLLNNANESHGPFWKSWAAKARRIHPELPSIERCHNYDIEYKFIYQCTRCATTIGRHSKSIDTSKKVCGRCAGKLVLNPPKKSDGSVKSRGSNPFANFVKENYKSTKSRIERGSPGKASHRDVMKSLSEQFKIASIS